MTQASYHAIVTLVLVGLTMPACQGGAGTTDGKSGATGGSQTSPRVGSGGVTTASSGAMQSLIGGSQSIGDTKLGNSSSASGGISPSNSSSASGGIGPSNGGSQVGSSRSSNGGTQLTGNSSSTAGRWSESGSPATGGQPSSGGKRAAGGDSSAGGRSSNLGSAAIGQGGKTTSTTVAGAGTGPSNPCDATGLVWKTANKTNYTSYPDPGSEECIKYNGCQWAGQFAACDGTKPESWVSSHNIVAAFPDFNALKLHDLCLRKGQKTIVVTVLDTCGDDDCNGCCTKNKGSADELIDVESYTDKLWGVPDGSIEWADLGPTKTQGCN